MAFSILAGWNFVVLLFVLRCKGGGVECVGGSNDGVGVGCCRFWQREGGEVDDDVEGSTKGG